MNRHREDMRLPLILCAMTSLILLQPVLQAQDMPTPTFHLPFDGTVDPDLAAGSARHPSLVRGEAVFTDGHQGQAVLLGGGPVLVYQAEGNVPDEATLSFWLKPMDWQTMRKWRKLVTICPGGRAGMMFAHYPGRKPVIQSRWGARYGGPGHEATTKPLTVNAWNHVAIAWNSMRTRIYFDGTLVLSRPHDNDYRPRLGARTTLHLGGIRLGTSSGSSYGSEPWGQADTALDEFTVYPGMLSAEQVAQLAGKTRAPHPLQGPPRDPQILAIPRIRAAPVIDGRITDDEWHHAAALPALIDARDPGRSFDYPRQDIRLAYDADHLLLALRVHIPSGATLARGATRGRPTDPDPRVFGDDSFELWLHRNDTDQRFRFAGNPAGGYTEMLNQDESWYGEWTYRTSVSTTVYGSEQWEIEVSIPFATLGMDDPQAADLTMNLCRTWRCLDALGLTTWSGYGQYPDVSYFGRIHLLPDAPGTYFETTGSPSTGNLRHSLRLTSAAGTSFSGTVQMTLEASHRENDRLVDAIPISLEANSEATVELACRVDDPMFRRVRYDIRRKTGEVVLLRYSVPFSLRTEFLDVVPLNLQHSVVVKPSHSLYVKRLTREGLDVASVEVEVLDPAGRRVAGYRVVNDDETRLELPTDGPWGDYRVVMTAIDRQGRTHEPNEQTFVRPETPVWAMPADDSASTVVLPPFTPLKTQQTADGDLAVSCWGRTYAFTNCVFPAAIETTAHGNLLAGPISLHTADKLAVDWDPAVGSQSEVRTEFEGKTAVGGATINAQVWTEYDGLVWYEITLTAETKVAGFRLQIPLPSSVARYMHCTASMMSLGGGRTAPLASVESLKYWPVVWIGNFERGLCFFTEGRRDLAFETPHPFTFSHRKDAVVMTAALTGDLEAGERRHLRFGLLATPVKPLHPRYPLNNFGYHSAIYGQIPQVPLHSTVWWTFHKWFLDLPDYHSALRTWGTPADWYPGTKDPAGTRWIPYLDPCTLTSEYPEARHYRREWEILPAQHRDGFKRKTPDGTEREFAELWMSPAAESYRKYYAWRVADLITRTGTHGLYFDFGCAMRDANRHHGANGNYYILGLRDFYRRIAYEFVKAGIEDYIIVVHNSKSVQIPALTFVTHFFNGEHHRAKSGTTLHDGRDYLDTLPLYYFGIEHSGLPWGIHGNMLPEFPEAKHLIEAVGATDETPSEYLWTRTPSVVMPTLLHGCLPGGVRVSQPYYKHVVDILHRFDIPSATFHPYWQNQDSVQVDHADVKTSIYSRPEAPRLLLVAGNVGDEDAEVSIKLDMTDFYDGWDQSPLRGMKHVVKRSDIMQAVERMGVRDARVLDLGPTHIRLWIRRHAMALVELNGYEKVR